jgi:hypothetical protein
MQTLASALTWAIANWHIVLGAVLALLVAVLGVLQLIPGNQGEAEIEAVIATVSRIDGVPVPASAQPAAPAPAAPTPPPSA